MSAVVIIGDEDLIKAIREGLGSESVGWEAPEVMEDGAAIRIGNLGLGAGLADAVNGGKQEVMSGRWTGAGGWPNGFQDGECAGVLSGQPESAGQPEFDGGSSDGDGCGAVLDKGGDSLSGAELGLLDDPGFAVDAAALDEVVIELVCLCLTNNRSRER